MKKILSILLIFLAITNASAQTIELKNTVIDHESNPLPFAYVIGKSSNIATVTDADGKFNFYITSNQLDSTFVFSYLGFSPLKVTGHQIRQFEKGVQA